MATLAIIGTSGRDNNETLNGSVYIDMLCIAKEFINQLAKYGYAVDNIISGGAPWADHIAVDIFIKRIVLRGCLHLPCQFTGLSFYGNMAASTLNTLHASFNQRVLKKSCSFSEISLALKLGMTCKIHAGFDSRNKAIAQEADFILAMTYGNKHIIKPGGTRNTIRYYLMKIHKEMQFNKAFHYNLGDKKLYINASI